MVRPKSISSSTVDVPKVNLAARLCDVYPDGTSALMTYGVLNLSHRNRHEFAEGLSGWPPFTVTPQAQ